MDRSFKPWKTIREGKCSQLRCLDQTMAPWRRWPISQQRGGTENATCLCSSGTLLTCGYQTGPPSHWAPPGSPLSINLCHHHLQQHQDWVGDYFTEDLGTFLSLEWPWQTWRKLFERFFLLILSLTLCVIALINIKGVNKYLQIISLTLKITKW